MSVDFTKFPFPFVENPHAATLTEGIASEPLDNGYVVVMAKVADADGFVEAARVFARSLRDDTPRSGLLDVTAYRHIRSNELGGAVPFDQAICEDAVRSAERILADEPGLHPTIGPALTMTRDNDLADWVLLVEFESVDRAAAASAEWQRGGAGFDSLSPHVTSTLVCAYRNMMRYATVSRDPDVIHFFNLFPGPGDLDLLWESWQEALPWFLETGEFRSSFPLLAVDPEQPVLIVNYAHIDSLKHFFLGVCYDPNYLETARRCYSGRGFTLPSPFFGKIVPV